MCFFVFVSERPDKVVSLMRGAYHCCWRCMMYHPYTGPSRTGIVYRRALSRFLTRVAVANVRDSYLGNEQEIRSLRKRWTILLPKVGDGRLPNYLHIIYSQTYHIAFFSKVDTMTQYCIYLARPTEAAMLRQSHAFRRRPHAVSRTERVNLMHHTIRVQDVGY